MKKALKTIIALLSVLTMAFALAACSGSGSSGAETTAANSTESESAAESSPEASSEETEAAVETSIMAGAGAAAIKFDAEIFTAESVDRSGKTLIGEGFSGEVESDPYARVLLFEDGEKAAIVSIELVNSTQNIVSETKKIINEKAGVPEDNVWVHVNHTITTPHAPADEALAALLEQNVLDAVTSAADDAVASYAEAVLGIAETTLDINTNRNVLVDDGQYHLGDACEDSKTESNKELRVLRFDSVEGEPIGMAISYGIKPTTIDNAEQYETTRKISSDLTGLACVMMEEEYGCPVMFIMPASADQFAKQTTNYYEYDETEQKYVDGYRSVAEGIEYSQKYGSEMGDACIALADTITCDITSAPVAFNSTSFEWASSKEGEDDKTLDISALSIGDDIVFVGFKPEMNAVTEAAIWAESPFQYTMMASFVNGDGSYMPDASGYEQPMTLEGKRAGYAVGCAEEFVKVTGELLNSIK